MSEIITEREDGTRKVTIECGPGRTRQEFKKDSDINVIIKKFQTTGTIKFRDENEAMYGDIPAMDFQQAMNTVRTATEMFEAMPAELRKRFGHDPYNFLEFIQDPKNVDEARLLKLIPAERLPDPEEPPANPEEPPANPESAP